MAIPDYQTLMLPVLKQAEKAECNINDVIDILAGEFKLSDKERAELLPSGKQTTIANRVHWAKSYLKQAGLVKITKRAHFIITDRGKEVLSNRPKKIDKKFLEKFPEFHDFQKRKGTQTPQTQKSGKVTLGETTPHEVLNLIVDQLNDQLSQELLERILAKGPAFFEGLLVQLLVSMGYGESVESAGQALGKTGDNGVDGVVHQDSLGLNRVYIQAKRYNLDQKIGPDPIRAFVGSLDFHQANKGVFVTTSDFTKSARETANKVRYNIALINGEELTKLMISHDVGCRIETVYSLKKIDEDFFEQ